jgi:hypothetical protein
MEKMGNLIDGRLLALRINLQSCDGRPIRHDQHSPAISAVCQSEQHRPREADIRDVLHQMGEVPGSAPAFVRRAFTDQVDNCEASRPAIADDAALIAPTRRTVPREATFRD